MNPKNLTLVALEFETTQNWQENLDTLTRLISQTSDNTIILAPEVCLTGFAYENMDEAVTFSKKALEKLLLLSEHKIIAFTMIETYKDGYINTFKVLHNMEVVHEQQKHKLFIFGGEDKHFLAGDEKTIKPFEVAGIRFGALICFELRFKALWKTLEGVDVILVPAMWGILRQKHFEVLTHALAIMNQCFVIASDSANNDMAKKSAIITPLGDITLEDGKQLLLREVDFHEIKKMRRYLNVGIS